MKVVLAILICIIIFCVSVFLYDAFDFCKFFFHDVLGWHKPTNDLRFDGYSMHSTCKHCGKEIMQDSQGGWF